MILFLQLQRLILLQNQAGHDIVDQDRSHIDDKQKQSVLRTQRNFQRRTGNNAVYCKIPYDIEGCGNQPQIPPLKAGRFFFYCRSEYGLHIKEDRHRENDFNSKEHQRERPAVALYSQCRKRKSLNAFGGNHGEVGKIGDHQQREKCFAEMLLHGEKIESGIQRRAERTGDCGMISGNKADPCAEHHLNDRQQSDQNSGNAS